MMFNSFTHMIIPCTVLVVDDGSPKAPSRVDAGSSDGDGCQVHQEHCKPDGKWSQDLHFNSYREGGLVFSGQKLYHLQLHARISLCNIKSNSRNH